LNVENISLSRTTVASDLTASDFIWCPVIEDLLYMKLTTESKNLISFTKLTLNLTTTLWDIFSKNARDE